MKEQVVAPRGVRRAATQSKGFVQKPARRDGSGPRRELSISPRVLLAYVPKALKVALAIAIIVTAIVGYRVAASASIFEVKTIDVTGASRVSSEEIQSLTRRAVSRTGVWRADLNVLSSELSRLPGVRRAVVTRVLPDGLRVRITERAPVAVVRTAAGHFVWVDEEGVTLGEMKPDDQMPAFFIRGWAEDGTEEAQKDNTARVQKYLELVNDWSAAGLTDRVSEVTLLDLRDIRVQLAGNDSQVEVRLGSQDAGNRLKVALEALDTYKQTARGSSITYVDIQTGRVIIGFPSGNRTAAPNASANSQNSGEGNNDSMANNSNSNTSPNAGKSTRASRNTNANKSEKNLPKETQSAPARRLR